jgi:hypothetical protein
MSALIELNAVGGHQGFGRPLRGTQRRRLFGDRVWRWLRRIRVARGRDHHQ